MNSIIFTTLLVSSFAHADWKVSRLTGEAAVVQGENKSALKLDDQVAEEALVETGRGARVELRSGSGVVFLGSNTKLKLQAQGTPQAEPMNLLYGKIRLHVEPTHGTSFRVQTKAAVSGVRGTEYFMQSDEQHDFICTLSGLVAVESKLNGESVLVPPHAGVEIASGKPFDVKPTPDDLVDKWYNDTSAEESRPIVTDSYLQLERRFHPAGDHFSYGLRANASFIATDHISYGPLPAPASNQISQFRISPALRFGDLVWEPRLYYHASSEPVVLDADPLLIKKTYARADVGEFFVEAKLVGTNFKLGSQSIKWNDGVLFSFNFWNLDPFDFYALRATRSEGLHFFDLFLAKRGDVAEVNGQVPADIMAFKYDYSTWVSLFAAHLDFTRGDATTPAVFRGHLIEDYGLQSNKRIDRFDYKISAILQQGKLFEAIEGAQRKASGSMFEGGLGWYPMSQQNLRLGVAYIHAAENFLPGFESPYNLGYSQVFVRSNLRQYRAKLSYAPLGDTHWSAYLEWIRSQSVGEGPFTKWTGSARDLMDETDLALNFDVLTNLRMLAAGFTTAPTQAMLASSPNWSRQTGYGGVVNLQYVY